MRKLTSKRALFYTLLIVFLSLFGVGCAGKRPAPRTPQTPAMSQAEADYERKLRSEGQPSARRVEASEPTLSPRDREIKLLARQEDLRQEYKRLEELKKKNYSPAEKKAEKQVASVEKRQADVQKRMNEVYSFARITGCPAGTVIVSDTAVPPAWKRRFFVNVTLDITNVGALPVNEIRAGNYGIIVWNLLSGCSLSVNFTMEIEGSDQKEVILTAISRPPDGGVSMTETRVYLNRGDMQSRQHRSEAWRINLQRQYQTR